MATEHITDAQLTPTAARFYNEDLHPSPLLAFAVGRDAARLRSGLPPGVDTEQPSTCLATEQSRASRDRGVTHARLAI